jgi:uncharacterized membrane protein YphA (DoxX/SURF4 family)
MRDLGTFLDDTIQAFLKPRPIVRLEAIRILAPLAIVGFMSSRVLHAEDWLATTGFRIPALSDDYRQPASWAGVPPAVAWTIAIGLVVSGLATSAGAFTRWSAGVFSALLVYVALADRMAAFTVSKISPVIALAIALSPAGARWSVDAWRRRRKHPKAVVPTHVSWGSVAFFQLFLPVFYFSSGLFKAKGAWLKHYYPYVLYTHLHDSYQTPVSWFLANHMPGFAWTALQCVTVLFEACAPLWFALKWTRPVAFAWGLAMHAMIGMMFGPVAWFSLLMMSLLVGRYAPATWLDPSLVRIRR